MIPCKTFLFMRRGTNKLLSDLLIIVASHKGNSDDYDGNLR